MKSKNGKTSRPKFHVYFPIAKVTDGSECRKQKEVVISYFPSFDVGAKDAARFFFGVEAPQVEYYPGNTLLSDFMKNISTQNSATNHKAPLDLSAGIPDGSRNNTLTRIAGQLWNAGFSRGAMLDALLAINAREGVVLSSRQKDFYSLAAGLPYSERKKHSNPLRIMLYC